MERRPAVNFSTAVDYSLVLQLIRESTSRSCWWNPYSSGLLYSGLIDTFPKGCAWSENKQQWMKQEMRISKRKVHLENTSSLWFLPLTSGISLLPRILLSFKSTSRSTCSRWQKWELKVYFRRLQKNRMRRKQLSQLPVSRDPKSPSHELLLWLQQHRKSQMWRVWQLNTHVWPNQHSAPPSRSWAGFCSCQTTLRWGAAATSNPSPLSETGWLHTSLESAELNKQPAALIHMQRSRLQLYLTVWAEPEEFPPTTLGK